MNHRQLRPKVVKDRIIRHDGALKRMGALLGTRDELHRALNKEYGFAETDGSFGIGKKSHLDSVYASKYDEIEKKYTDLRSKEREREVATDTETLSIWEYLLFDNMSTEAKKYVKSEADKYENDTWHDFVLVRAKGEISRWREVYTIGEIMKLIRHEKSDFSYRATRCRRDLNISKLDLGAQKAIFDFKSSYMRDLKQIFEALEA